MPLTIAEIMSRMPAAFVAERAAGVEAVIHFRFTGAEAGEWHAVIKDGACKVAEGRPQGPATMTLTADSSDYIGLITGELDPMKAFMTGRLKLQGDLNLAMKMTQLFRVDG